MRRAYGRALTAELREAVDGAEVEERARTDEARDEERVSKPGERERPNPATLWFRDARWRSLLNHRDALAPRLPRERLWLDDPVQRRHHPLINTSHPVAQVAKRALLTVFGIPMLVAIAMSLVDSYRRRGKKPKPFPTRTAQQTPVGDGTVTTYTFGQDLYDDMLAAIEGAQKQVLLETYIWKGDAVGQRFKKALIDAADRGVEVRVIYDSVRQHRRAPAVQALPAEREGARLPRLLGRLALLRPAPLRPRPPQDPRRRRRGRVRRRLQHRLGLRHGVARHALPDHRTGGVGPDPGLRRLLEPAPREAVQAAASRRC